MVIKTHKKLFQKFSVPRLLGRALIVPLFFATGMFGVSINFAQASAGTFSLSVLRPYVSEINAAPQYYASNPSFIYDLNFIWNKPGGGNSSIGTALVADSCPANATCTFIGGSATTLNKTVSANTQAAAQFAITWLNSTSANKYTINFSIQEARCSNGCVAPASAPAVLDLKQSLPGQTLTLGAQSVNFNAIANQATLPGTIKTYIYNYGAADLNWNAASPNATWCHVNGGNSPVSGTAPPASFSALTISVDPMAAPGNYTCSIGVTSNDNFVIPSQRNILVTYQVTGSPTVTASTTTCQQVVVQWNNFGASGYNIYRSALDLNPNNATLIAGNVQGTSYTDNRVTSGDFLSGQYAYWAEPIGTGQGKILSWDVSRGGNFTLPLLCGASLVSGGGSSSRNGGGSPKVFVEGLGNGGSAPLNWSASSSASWCNFKGATSTSGSIPPGGYGLFLTGMLAPTAVGSHSCAVTYTAAGAANSPGVATYNEDIYPIKPADGGVTTANPTCEQINITWVPGTLSSAYNVLRAAHPSSGNSALQSNTIDNTVTTVASNIPATPFSASYTDTTVAPGTLYDYAIQTVGGIIINGVHSDFENATSNSTGQVTPQCRNHPLIILDPTTFTFTAPANGPVPAGQTLSISKRGDPPLSWFAATNQPWCHVTPATGSDDGTTTVTVDSLATAGTYACTITVGDRLRNYSQVTASVNYVVTLPPPLNVNADNSICGQVTLSWNTPNATGSMAYNIYRNSTSNLPAYPIISGLTTTSYTDTPPNPGTGYYYWVTAYNNGMTSPYASVSLNPITPRLCQANLNDSDLDIVSVNNSPLPGTTAQCDGSTGFEIYPNPSILFKTGDIVTFGINLCNDQGKADATNVSFSSQLISYVKPPGGWNVRINGSPASDPVVNPASREPNEKLLFTIGTVPQRGITTVYFNAQVSRSYSSSRYLRTQNNVKVTYDVLPGSPTNYNITTPLLLAVDPSQVSPIPTKNEVAP